MLDGMKLEYHLVNKQAWILKIIIVDKFCKIMVYHPNKSYPKTASTIKLMKSDEIQLDSSGSFQGVRLPPDLERGSPSPARSELPPLEEPAVVFSWLS